MLSFARGPLSSSPPTRSSLLLNLYPPWAGFLAVLASACLWGSLSSVADPCFSQEAQPGECAGSPEASLTWAWGHQSGVSCLAKSDRYPRVLSWGLHTFHSFSPQATLLKNGLLGFDFHPCYTKGDTAALLPSCCSCSLRGLFGWDVGSSFLGIELWRSLVSRSELGLVAQLGRAIGMYCSF